MRLGFTRQLCHTHLSSFDSFKDFWSLSKFTHRLVRDVRLYKVLEKLSRFTLSDGLTNMRLDKGVFANFLHGRPGFVPENFSKFRLGGDLSQNDDTHVSNGSKPHLMVVASSNLLKQLLPNHKLRK